MKRQFEEKWQHNTKTPEVKHIYKICCDQRILDRYTKYRYVPFSLCAPQKLTVFSSQRQRRERT